MNTNMFNEEMVNAMIAEAVEAERKVMQAKIETLYAMYELATKQRDYLMDQQSAQVAAMLNRRSLNTLVIATIVKRLGCGGGKDVRG